MSHINTWRARVPGTDTVLPMIAIGGLTDAQISVLESATGRDVPDLLDEHTSWIWFHDRASWRLAWSASRLVARGAKVSGLPPRTLCDGPLGTILDISAHHVTEAA